MANNNTPLEQLKFFLNQLFQFDSQDLDFGVYKILHYKRKEIANFIDQLLVDKVKEQLQTLSADEAKKIKEQITDFERDDIIKGWLEAEADEKKTLEKFGKDKINQYKELRAKATEATVSVGTENQIYNHLTLFFSRYYDKGDFISKRRFGKNEKYMVPYNGEETHFHWANHDQYYIKSSETFNHYAFKVQTHEGSLIVNFKLHNAQLEQGNVKADEPNFFILANKQPDVSKKEITIYFEYRPLTDDEKKKIKGNSKQDKLDENAFEHFKKEFSTNPLFANLWKEHEGKPLLLKKLQHYTRKNNHDFFIHKNLKGFLEKELDFYIKSELVNVDDLYMTDSDAHFDRLRHKLKTIKVFKAIADTIIAFVSQIEDFQKKLWEKKKFVLSTEWVITIDRLVEYIGEDEAKPILDEVIKNEKQVAEWKDLFGTETIIGKFDDTESLKADLHSWKKLPIDTLNFSIDFRENLFNCLASKINVETELNGLIINSDNFHGLVSVRDVYSGKIAGIHIDPPYNTATSGFLYKNTYQHSSWLSMMADRIQIAKELLSKDGLFQVHIDENEYENLFTLFKQTGLFNAGTIIWDKKNPMLGRKGVATQHEYILWFSNIDKPIYLQNKNVRKIVSKAREFIKNNNGVNEKTRTEFARWVLDQSDFSGGEKMYRNIDNEGLVYRGVSMGAPEKRTDPKYYEPILHPLTGEPCPIPSNGWSRSPDTIKGLLEDGDILFGKNHTTQPEKKVVLKEDSKKQLSSIIEDGKSGKAYMDRLGLFFPYCHPVSLYVSLQGAISSSEDIYLDFFAGSGTTFHATIELNKEDNGNRKCILIEQGPYVNTIIIPRIKKIAYTFDWKGGKPKDGSMDGLGVFFKYQRLEQYEETLENIAFNASDDAIQKALEFDQYIPKYFLEFETKGSQSLVNTAAMQDPWNYKLKIWDSFTYDTEQAVDLVETFNYLIGLHMQKCITKEINGKKYQFISGHNNDNKNILVVWRSVKDWSLEDYKEDATALKEELHAFTYDLLYINDQAHIEGYQPIEEVFRNKMLS